MTDELGTVIEDLDSINGVQVNADTVKSYRLCDGDSVQIGKNLFVFSDPQQAALTEP